MKIKLLTTSLLVSLFFSSVCFAQILDDDFGSKTTSKTEEELQTEKEALFDEMFGDYTEKALETTNENNGELEEFATELADHMKKVNIIDPRLKAKEQRLAENKKPTEGELYIGVSKGSFRLFKDIVGKMKCSFGVTLKSTLNKEINNFSLRLIYPHGTYAFIFRDIKAGGSDERFITTSGDICYNLSGVPDIDINRCRIYGASEKECAKRLIWDEQIESPDMSKNPYIKK